jgi:hypothetical protein
LAAARFAARARFFCLGFGRVLPELPRAIFPRALRLSPLPILISPPDKDTADCHLDRDATGVREIIENIRLCASVAGSSYENRRG